jgi:hypothetical protein
MHRSLRLALMGPAIFIMVGGCIPLREPNVPGPGPSPEPNTPPGPNIPTPVGPTTLVSQTLGVLFPVTFNPTVVGKLITVTISSTNPDSRITVSVIDPNGVTIASVIAPITNITTVSFPSTSTGSYTITPAETGVAGAYALTVIQSL